MGGKATRRARTKRAKGRNDTWNVHVEGMVFPFTDEKGADQFISEIVAEHPEMGYTKERSQLDSDHIMTVGE